MILVRRHSDEGRLGEDVGAESCVFGAEAVVLVCFDDVETRLVLVHGVQNYLNGSRGFDKERVRDLPCFQNTTTFTEGN